MANTQQLLMDAVQKFASAPLGVSDVTTEAFQNFRKGVTQASGKGGDADSLLGDLQPKEPTFRHLIELYGKKKMYRKQIEAAFVEILRVDSWLEALRNDDSLPGTLPDSLAEIYEKEKDRPIAPPPQSIQDAPIRVVEEPITELEGLSLAAPPVVQDDSTVNSTSQDVSRSPTAAEKDSMIRQAVANLQASKEKSYKVQASIQSMQTSDAKRVSVTDSTLVLLEKACREMNACNYSADQRDAACETLEVFNRAVTRVVNSYEKDDDEVLDAVENKDYILMFLVDVLVKHHKYRNYVKSIFKRLYDDSFPNWKEAIEDDASVLQMVEELLGDRQVVRADGPPSKSVKRADARGSLGVLRVLVKAAEGLPNVDTDGSLSDPFVRATLFTDGKQQRIHQSLTINDDLNPKWNCQWDFEVPTLESTIKFEIFHDDPKKEIQIGQLWLKASELPKELPQDLGHAEARKYDLKGVQNAKIYIALAFLPAPSLIEDSASEDKDEVDGTVEEFIKGERRPLKYVAWVSVDPRKGELVAYDAAIATNIEFALSEGDDQADINDAIKGAKVQLDCYPFRQQTSAGSSRYVARCQMAERGGSISVSVASNSRGQWRIEDRGETSIRTLKMDEDQVIDAMDGAAQHEAKVREWNERRSNPGTSSFGSAPPKGGSFSTADGKGYPKADLEPAASWSSKAPIPNRAPKQFKVQPGGAVRSSNPTDKCIVQ